MSRQVKHPGQFSTGITPLCWSIFGRRQHEIFNTDQGSQFTAEAFTEVLRHNAICISMDGKGRWIDNVFVEQLWRSVKYEDIYLYAHETPMQVNQALSKYLDFSTPAVLTKPLTSTRPMRCTSVLANWSKRPDENLDGPCTALCQYQLDTAH
jgi:transposase InsO family protein